MFYLAGKAFTCLVSHRGAWLFLGQGRRPPVILFSMIRNISPHAQQEIPRAIGDASSTSDKIILCHTPALLDPVENCSLGTFDQVDECIEANMSMSLILPRPGPVQNLVKKHSGKVVNFNVVFYVNASAGPIEACVDLLLKARHWFPNICRVQKCVNLKKGLLGNFAVTTYIVEVWMQPSDKFLIKWKFDDRKYQDELLIPKIALAEQDIQDIIDEQGSKLLLKSTNRNSCVDFDDSKNGQWISFPYGGSKQQSELNRLVSVIRDKLRQYPSSSLQLKRAVCWNSKLNDLLSFGFLFLGHLNAQDKARVANFLTGCNIDFFFSRIHVLVMKLDGLDDNTLLRLAQYAEVPIPACPMQGGFQVNFFPQSSSTIAWTTCSIGRIGSYDHIPAQVQVEVNESEASIEDVKWIVSLLEQHVKATCFQKVFCKPENQDSTACLQFLIPMSFENKLPLHWRIDDRQIRVDHPVAFTIPLSISRRPPEEQNKLEHWKETANRSFSYRKGRHNSLSRSRIVRSLLTRCVASTCSDMAKY